MAIINKYSSRKRIESVDAETMMKTIALISEFIPKQTFEQIEKRAREGDAEAMLKLADCYMFGLKGVPRNAKTGCELYSQAANMGLPEAYTMVAQICYMRLLKDCGLEEPAAIPAHSTSPDYQFHKEYIWSYLEKAAEANYVSPMLIKTAQT
jgi:TPR repeat protein